MINIIPCTHTQYNSFTLYHAIDIWYVNFKCTWSCSISYLYWCYKEAKENGEKTALDLAEDNIKIENWVLWSLISDIFSYKI